MVWSGAEVGETDQGWKKICWPFFVSHIEETIISSLEFEFKINKMDWELNIKMDPHGR